jgi:hypothetical protein
MKHLMTIFGLAVVLLTFSSPANAQAVITKESMTNATIGKIDELVIVPSKTSSARDFDFLAGNWTMDNKRLKTRLNNCTEWTEFKSTSENLGRILEGIGNLDFYRTTFDGKPFEGMTIRLFNPQTRLWSLYWIPSNTGVMDPPVVGSFEGNVGRFYCRDLWEGKPVIVIFKWDKTDPENPVWSQAFSADNGKTWEWNYTNTSHKVNEPK